MEFTEHIKITIIRIYTPTFSRVWVGQDISPAMHAGGDKQGEILIQEVDRIRGILDARANKAKPSVMIAS